MSKPEPNLSAIELKGKGFSLAVDPANGRVTIFSRRGEDAPIGDTGPFILDEFLGSPEDDLSLGTWEAHQEEGSVRLSTCWRSIAFEKTITPDPDRPLLRLEYAFLNTAPILHRIAFGLRLSVVNERIESWEVPTAEGLRSGSLSGEAERRYLRPNAAWCGIALKDRRTVFLLPEEVMDAVEIREKPDAHFYALSCLIYAIGLSPGCEARFSCLLHLDAPTPAQIPEWRKRYASTLNMNYGPVSSDRMAQGAARKAVHSESKKSESALVPVRREHPQRAEELATGQEARLKLLARLREDEIGVDEVIQEWIKADAPPRVAAS